MAPLAFVRRRGPKSRPYLRSPNEDTVARDLLQSALLQSAAKDTAERLQAEYRCGPLSHSQHHRNHVRHVSLGHHAEEHRRVHQAEAAAYVHHTGFLPLLRSARSHRVYRHAACLRHAAVLVIVDRRRA